MPELPEVESLRRFLENRAVGLDFEKVQLHAFSALKTFDPPLDSLVGRTITAVHRRGKFLAFETDDGLFLALHLARGGWLRWFEELPTPKSKGGKGPLALRLRFSDGSGAQVTEAGTEKRLAIHVVERLDDMEYIKTLGPDPLLTPAASIVDRLSSQSGRIKAVLTDQRVIAGVGNAYSDEALHMARLSPYKNANKLTDDERQSLVDAIVTVLTDAVERSKDVPVAGLKGEKKSGLRVHGRVGQECPVCGDTIREVSFATKAFQYCPTCQTAGKPLADRRMSRLLK